MNFFKQKFRSIKKFPTWLYWIPARLMQLTLHTIYRFEVIDPLNQIPTARGRVCVTWHNRLMLFAVVFPKEVRQRTVAVVSASRDGQYIADFILMLGLKSLRGSSTRGGSRAQLQAVRSIRDGLHVCFTPDGPKGPRYQMKNGPIQLASITGHPVVPLSINYSACWEVHSWDRFQIPKPFSKVTLIIGSPIPVPPELDREQLEVYRRKIEQGLLEITVDPKRS